MATIRLKKEPLLDESHYEDDVQPEHTTRFRKWHMWKNWFDSGGRTKFCMKPKK